MTAVGSFIDNRLFGPSMGNTTQEGPRLDSLQVQASTEGAAILEIADRVRIAGQIIWATNFREAANPDCATLRRRQGPSWWRRICHLYDLFLFRELYCLAWRRADRHFRRQSRAHLGAADGRGQGRWPARKRSRYDRRRHRQRE